MKRVIYVIENDEELSLSFKYNALKQIEGFVVVLHVLIIAKVKWMMKLGVLNLVRCPDGFELTSPGESNSSPQPPSITFHSTSAAPVIFSHHAHVSSLAGTTASHDADSFT